MYKSRNFQAPTLAELFPSYQNLLFWHRERQYSRMNSSILLAFVSSLVLALQLVTCMSDVEKPQLMEDSTNDVVLLKRSLRQAFESQIAMLQEAETSLTEQIKNLEHQRQEITQRKRSHYMCLVNLITCYRKRK